MRLRNFANNANVSVQPTTVIKVTAMIEFTGGSLPPSSWLVSYASCQPEIVPATVFGPVVSMVTMAPPPRAVPQGRPASRGTVIVASGTAL